MLELYSKALEELQINPNIPELFRNIFKNAYLPYRDPATLKLFLKYINEFENSHSEKLGDAFEYLLSVMGGQGDAGQFRSPRNIIDFVTACVNPQKNETVADPACGTAGLQRVPKDFVATYLVPLPSMKEQRKIIQQIEQEYQYVDSNKQLIALFEQKIKDKIDEAGRKSNQGIRHAGEELSMVAES